MALAYGAPMYSYCGCIFNIMLLLCLCMKMSVGMACNSNSSNFEFRVGGEGITWSEPPPASLHIFDQWAHRIRFRAGDSLLFVYEGDEDSVLEVSEKDYHRCRTSEPKEFFDDGNTRIALATPGASYYFISGRTGKCGKGQKVHIKVEGGEDAKPLNPSPSPAYSNHADVPSLPPSHPANSPSPYKSVASSPSPSPLSSSPKSAVASSPSPHHNAKFSSPSPSPLYSSPKSAVTPSPSPHHNDKSPSPTPPLFSSPKSAVAPSPSHHNGMSPSPSPSPPPSPSPSPSALTFEQERVTPPSPSSASMVVSAIPCICLVISILSSALFLLH